MNIIRLMVLATTLASAAAALKPFPAGVSQLKGQLKLQHLSLAMSSPVTVRNRAMDSECYADVGAASAARDGKKLNVRDVGACLLSDASGVYKYSPIYSFDYIAKFGRTPNIAGLALKARKTIANPPPLSDLQFAFAIEVLLKLDILRLQGVDMSSAKAGQALVALDKRADSDLRSARNACYLTAKNGQSSRTMLSGEDMTLQCWKSGETLNFTWMTPETLSASQAKQ